MAGRKSGAGSTVNSRSTARRTDKNRVVLRTGEYQRSDNGKYFYRWTDRRGIRHHISADTLKELREKETAVQRDTLDGIITMERSTLNDIFKLWLDIKRGLKDNTKNNYIYMYEQYVMNDLGRMKVSNIKKSDIRQFYNRLVDSDRLRINTVDTLQNIIHQILDVAVDDGYLRSNPADKALTELKRIRCNDTKKIRALTLDEQKALLSYIKGSEKYVRWYPLICFMVGTGMRIGEVLGLRWVDVDLDNGLIDVNHTLVYMNHLREHHCHYEINTTKTRAGTRVVPMISMVREALDMERKRNEQEHIRCNASIAGYTDFIFLNRFGYTLNHSVVNKVLSRIVRDYNEEQFALREKGAITDEEMLLLPNFSCHVLRHTFATRLVESGVNVKVIQETLGHTDVTTTLNIYADATEDLKRREFEMFEKDFM